LSFPNSKKILIVAESIDIEDSSGTKGRVALIKNLANIGYNIKVYHYTRKEIQIKGVECFSIKEKRRSALFLFSRIERYFRKFFRIYLNKSLEKIFGFSFTLYNDRNSIISALKSVKGFEPDLVLTLSKGGSFRPHHALLKMPEFHNKWAAYIHDPYPMHLYPRPYAWVEPGYYKKWKFMKNMSSAAAVSIFPSKLLMEWMGSYFEEFQLKGRVIPHQIIESAVEPENELPTFIDKNHFNILHAGNLLWGRDPKGLINAFCKFLNLYPNAKRESKLLFIGPENHYSDYLKDICDKNCEIYVSKNSLSFSQTQKLQQISSVNVILEAKSEISPFLPGKFPHCVKANKPILLLGPYYSECRRLMGEGYPYWAEVDQEDKILDSIVSLYHQWKNGSTELKLSRPDLQEYLFLGYLENTMNQILRDK
jgi:hypothetical protein